MDCWVMIEAYKIVRGKEMKRDWLLLVYSSARNRGDQINSACGMSSTWTNFESPRHKNLWMPIARMIQKADLSTALKQICDLWPWIVGSWGIIGKRALCTCPDVTFLPRGTSGCPGQGGSSGWSSVTIPMVRHGFGEENLFQWLVSE